MTGPVGGAGELNLRVCLECEQHKSGNTCTNCGAIWFNERWIKTPSLVEAGNLLAYWYHVKCHEGNAANMAKCKHDGCIDWQAALAAVKAPQGVSARTCFYGNNETCPYAGEAAAPKPVPAAFATSVGTGVIPSYSDPAIVVQDGVPTYTPRVVNQAEQAGPAPGAERLREALSKLVNECRGVVGLSGDKLRFIIGNTNFAVFDERIAEGREALAAAPPAPTKPSYILGMTTIHKVAEFGCLDTEHVAFVAADDLWRQTVTTERDRHASAERVRQIIEHAKTKRPCAEHYILLLKDLAGALPPSTGEKVSGATSPRGEAREP